MTKPLVENYNIIPGKILVSFLKNLFPLDTQSKSFFVNKIDETFQCEGEFAEITYNSCINYLARRLIRTAEYYKRKNTNNSTFYLAELRNFIKFETKIPEAKIARLVEILDNCLIVKKRPNDTLIKTVINNAKNKGGKCYICGGELVFDKEGNNRSSIPEAIKAKTVEVEHEWPNALGGPSEAFNLKAACNKCNGAKESYIDASDFHYEEICLVTDESDEKFSNEFKYSYKVAVWAKSGFKCAYPGCDLSPADVGTLKILRKKTNDSWHFLNVVAYCPFHARRMS